MPPLRKRTVPIPGCEIDYWSKLSPDERRWLRQFNHETQNAYFPKGPGKRKPLLRKDLHLVMDRARYARRSDFLSLDNPLPLKETTATVLRPNLEDAIDAIGENAKLSDYLGKNKG